MAEREADKRTLGAATFLGEVYDELRRLGYHPLGDWVLKGHAGSHGQIETAIAHVLPDSQREKQRHREFYENAYDAVIPTLEKKAGEWARGVLSEQETLLDSLCKLLDKADTCDRIHLAARKVFDRARQLEPIPDEKKFTDDLDKFNAAAAHHPKTKDVLFLDPQDIPLLYERFTKLSPQLSSAGYLPTSQDLEAFTKRRLTIALNLELKDASVSGGERTKEDENSMEEVKMLMVLFAPAHGVQILSAFCDAPDIGGRLARAEVQQALSAIAELHGSLKSDPKDVWRYPPVIFAAIKLLGLRDVAGFPDFAMELCDLLGLSKVERATNVLGIFGAILFGVLMVTGAPVSPGLAVLIGFSDALLAGVGTGLTYLRERQREVAGQATKFLPEEEKFTAEMSLSANYSGTALAGASALVSTIFLVGGLAGLMMARKAEQIALAEEKQLEEMARYLASPKTSTKTRTPGLETGSRFPQTPGSPTATSRGTDRPMVSGRSLSPEASGLKSTGKSRDIEAMIREELEGVSFTEEVAPLTGEGMPGYIPPPPPRRPVVSFENVVMDFSEKDLARYRERYPSYFWEEQQKYLSGERPGEPLHFKQYVRYRYGIETGQLLPPLNEDWVEIGAGYTLENIMDVRLGSANTLPYPNPYGKPVIPDHLPQGKTIARLDSRGYRTSKGGVPFSARLVADSKYLEKIGSTPQTRGFVNLARFSDEKTLVVTVRWQEGFPEISSLRYNEAMGGYVLPESLAEKLVTKPMREFAAARGRSVMIRLISDPMWK